MALSPTKFLSFPCHRRCYLIDGNGRCYVDIWNEFHSLSRELSVVQVLTAPDLETAFLISATENGAKR